MKKYPFLQKDISKDTVVRTFKKDVHNDDLEWHYDNEDRIVFCNEETDWKFQFDDQLPFFINGEIFIKKGEWHRLIKGSKDLTLTIKKLNNHD